MRPAAGLRVWIRYRNRCFQPWFARASWGLASRISLSLWRYSALARLCSLAFCSECISVTSPIKLSAQLLQIVQRDLGRAIEPHGHDGRSRADGRVSVHCMVPPGARAQSPGQDRIERYGNAAGQADLPAMGVTAQEQVEAGMSSLAVDLGGVRKQNGELLMWDVRRQPSRCCQPGRSEHHRCLRCECAGRHARSHLLRS